MDIDINLCRIKINKQNIHRETITRYHSLESIHHRVVQVRAFNKTIVNKKILLTSCLLSGFRLSNKPIDIQVIGFFFYGY